MTDAIGQGVFGAVFEISADAALVARRDTGRIISANRRACELLARPFADVIGMAFDELLLEHDHDATITHVELPGHGALTAVTLRDLSTRDREIAMLAWRAAMGEVVSGIAHHLNNPVAALSSTLRRLGRAIHKLPPEQRGELAALYTRVEKLAFRVETNVSAIVSASRTDALQSLEKDHALPAELAAALSTFAGQLNDLHRRPTT